MALPVGQGRGQRQSHRREYTPKCGTCQVKMVSIQTLPNVLFDKDLHEMLAISSHEGEMLPVWKITVAEMGACRRRTHRLLEMKQLANPIKHVSPPLDTGR